jgi:hypothetical protein
VNLQNPFRFGPTGDLYFISQPWEIVESELRLGRVQRRPLAALARACGLSPAALCVAPTGLGSNLAFSQRLRAGLISAAPGGAGLWMLRAVRLPPLGLAFRPARLSSRGWLIERPGFHRGAGLSRGPAFTAELDYREARLSSRDWLFHACRVPGCSPICSVAKHDRISTVLFLQRIIVCM